MLISAGDRIQCGDYVLHSRFDRVVNFAQDRQLVSLVVESVGAGPLNLVFRGTLPSGNNLHIEDTGIAVDGVTHQFPARFCSSTTIADWDPDFFYRNLDSLHQQLIEQAPAASLAFLLDDRRKAAFRPGFEQELVRRICESVHLIFMGRLKDGVRGLSGCGSGLTPAGDDFIAGLLTARHMRRQMLGEAPDPEIPLIREAARTDNLISDSMIECASEGCLSEPLLRLVKALNQATGDDLKRAIERVLKTGASSGADWLTGLCMTLMADFDTRKEVDSVYMRKD